MAVVLLVSSDPEARDGWRDGLVADGHTVLLATTAAAALHHLREQRVDVIAVEYEVAGGIALLTADRSRSADPPPMVLISGTAEAPSESAHLGVAAFLPKPCPARELAAVVLRVIPTPLPVEDEPTSPTRR